MGRVVLSGKGTDHAALSAAVRALPFALGEDGGSIKGVTGLTFMVYTSRDPRAEGKEGGMNGSQQGQHESW